jgi:hypothetical protein
MSNYPGAIDDDSTLPAVNDNLTEIGGDAINALRDAVMQIELTLGTNIQGSQPSLAARLGVFINPDGTPNTSVLTSLGLVTLPITNSQIAQNAGIPESKLTLDFRTQDLYNFIKNLSNDVNTSIGWISVSGVKLEPHLIGAIYRHTMDQVDVSTNIAQFLNNNLRLLRNNTQSYTLVNDINNELLAHQWADGSPFGILNNITTNNGSLYSTYYAHTASGIFLNPSRFATIPQTKVNLQLFAEYIDTSSIFLLGTRIQNLYSAGISNISRASSLTTDGYGQFLVPPTPAVAYLKNIGNLGNPFDDINSGDDIVQLFPSAANTAAFYFDSQFALVRPGDIIRILYADGYNLQVPYRIREKKYIPSTHTYIVRIAGKNQFYSPHAIARIDRPLFNSNKSGVLAIAPANNETAITSAEPSLVISNPRGAQALGLGFNPNEFDEKHYLLYLALYPTGYAQDGYTILPGIDVTGNQGKTPGQYTLESIVLATNNAFRSPGFNFRFTAFAYQGNFGISLADSYNNAGFSILSVVQNPAGIIDPLSTALNFPNNVVDLLPTIGTVGPDPLGFGPSGAGVASPPFQFAYGSSAAAINPAKLFVSLRRNNFYVNGGELERLAIPNLLTEFSTQALDGYGDGYWVATVQNVANFANRTQATYRIFQDLSDTDLKIGKTIVVQSLGAGNIFDFGRFIIQSVSFNCAPNVYTDITVYDAVHGKGFQPPVGSTIQPFNKVAVYFSDDSTSFNLESATDFQAPTPSGQFKRHFETYVDDLGETFTQERGRFTVTGGNVVVNEGITLYGYAQLNKMDIVTISPKLRGYQFGSVNKITFNVFSFTSATGIIDGYLASFDGTSLTHTGPRTQGKIGEVIRYYDETFHDYIDIKFDPNTTQVLSDFTNQQIDIQLFPTLQLDDELLFLGTVQVNDTTQVANKVVDQRNFGNIGTKDLNTAVYDFMASPERYFHSNGIVRGFDIANTYSGGTKGVLNLAGGTILVNGKILNVNNETVVIPAVQELYHLVTFSVRWALCINDVNEYVLIPLLDPDPSFVANVPTISTRTFTAFDFVSSTSYTIPAVTFSDMIGRRPDVTPLYIITSTVTGTPTTPIVTITTQDIRKYAFKRDWGYIPTWSSDPNNGDFRTFSQLQDWFNLNNLFSNTVYVKGTFTTLPGSITFNGGAVFNGDGVANLNPSGGALSVTNVELNNINFNVSQLTLIQCNANGCTFNYTSSGVGSTFGLFIGLGTTTASITNSIINYGGTSGNLQFYGQTVLNNATINMTGTGNALVFSGEATDCTINVNAAASGCSIFINTGAGVQNCVFNLTGNVQVTIQGNSINNTFNWTNGSGQLPITVTSSTGNSFGLVNNNFIIPSSAASPNSMLIIPDASNGTIIGNHFYRNGNTLTNGFINGPLSYSSGVVAIEDNFFDSSTIDGSNQNLVQHLPLPWLLGNNLNAPPTFRTRLITSGPYTITAIDHVIVTSSLTAPLTINLPQLSLIPLGRIIIIKDGSGNFDSFPLTLHRALASELIENIQSDYTYQIPYGSLTLVAVPNGWIII